MLTKPAALTYSVDRARVKEIARARRQLVWFFGGVLAFLIVATVIGRLLTLRAGDAARRATLANLNARIHAWWVMVAVFAVAILGGRTGAFALFGLISFFALREFVALARPATPIAERSSTASSSRFPCSTTCWRSSGAVCSAS